MKKVALLALIALVLAVATLAEARWVWRRIYFASDWTVTTKTRYVSEDSSRTIAGQVAKHDTLVIGNMLSPGTNTDVVVIGIEYATDAGMDTTLDCWVEQIHQGQYINIPHPVTLDSMFIKISGKAGSRQSGVRAIARPWLGPDSIVVHIANRNAAADSATGVRTWVEYWESE